MISAATQQFLDRKHGLWIDGKETNDYGGGELVVVEQRPRAQSRPTAVAIPQGHAVVLTTQDRPARSTRGWTTHAMRHGVSTVTWGRRHTLGIIFHDAA